MAGKSTGKKPLGNRRTCPLGHVFFKSSDCPVCPVCGKQKPVGPAFLQGLAAPARRALEKAGIKTVEDLFRWKEADLLRLHGLGPASIPVLRKALTVRKTKSKKR